MIVSLNLTVFNKEEEFMVNLLVSGEDGVDTDVWYLDNGVSNRMTVQRAKFKDLDEKLQRARDVW